MHRIIEMKDKLIEEARSRMQNLDGGSIEQMGQIIDMIKDLSEAEKACLEADYYEAVVDAMEDDSDGYTRMYDGDRRQGYSGQSYSGNRSTRQGYRNAKGQYARRPRRMRRSGYTDESVENLRHMMEEADPERKRQLKQDLQELMQEM